MNEVSGKYFKGEVTVAGTTGTILVLYDEQGNVIPLLPEDQLQVTDFTISGDAAGQLDLYFGTSATIVAGRGIVSCFAAANTPVVRRNETPALGPPGYAIYFKAGSAGNYRASVVGKIRSKTLFV